MGRNLLNAEIVNCTIFHFHWVYAAQEATSAPKSTVKTQE